MAVELETPATARAADAVAPKTLDALESGLRLLLATAATGSLVVELVVVLANLISREGFGYSFSWEPAVSQLALVVMAFVGGALAYVSDKNIKVDILVSRLGDRARARYDASICWIGGGVAALVCWWAIGNYAVANTAIIPGLSLGAGSLVAIIAGGAGSIALCSGLRLLRHSRRDILIGFVPAVVIVATTTTLALRFASVTASSDLPVLIGSVVAVVTLLAGAPVEISLLLLPVIADLGTGTPHSYVPTQLQAGVSSFILLAIPFFIFAGHLLTEGGLGNAIIEMLSPLLRRAPGGVLQLAIGTMFVFSGMSGAKIADVAAVGTALKDSLASEGYSKNEAAAVLSVCASAGETVPPSVAMLILGSITSLSIGTLFMAGILPALLVSVSIGALVAVRDRRHRVRDGVAKTSSAPWTWVQLARGLPALGLPVLLVGGIESGIVTPTESGAVAVAYAILVGFAIRAGLSGKRLVWIAVESAAMSGMVLLLIAVANAVAGALAIANIPQTLAADIARLGNSQVPLLLLTVLFVPIGGAVLEGVPAILVFGPLLVPIATHLGINGVAYGVVFILAMGLGAFSPLLGIGFFTACRVLDADIANAARRYVGYYVVMLATTALIAFVPSVTLFLPRLLGMPGT